MSKRNNKTKKKKTTKKGENKMKTIRIDGIDYVPRKEKEAKKLKGMKYVMCRTYSAGVFAGYLESRKKKEVVLRKARRIWYWSGAASLSQLAMEGTSDPENCKFPCEVDRVELLDTIEILDVTEKAKKNIAEVEIWKE